MHRYVQETPGSNENFKFLLNYCNINYRCRSNEIEDIKIKEMKKIICIAAVITTPFVVAAQNIPAPIIDKDIFNAIASIFVVGLFMIFIFAILKRLLDNRLKNKIVDKGIPENIAASILQTNSKEDKNVNIKWFSILAGTGIGLTIINYTLPLGFHSLAIMAFSISFSFLSYYFFIRNQKNN